MIISEIQSEIGHCSCDSAKFKAPADFSHHAILCMTLSLKEQSCWDPIVHENGHLTIPTYEIYHKCALISFSADAACR